MAFSILFKILSLNCAIKFQLFSENQNTTFQATNAVSTSIVKIGKKSLLSEIESWNIEKLSSNDQKTKVKPACKDKKSKDICQHEKNKHNGKGCTRKRIKELCKETCGLCPDGELNIIS